MKRKYKTWEEAMALAEVKALIQLTHPNIIKMKETLRCDNQLYIVMELLDKDLGKIIRGRRHEPFTEDEVRSFMYQLINGLSYIHKNGFFHRDLKPDNILI